MIQDNLLLRGLQGEAHKPVTKEEYKRQYHLRTRILMIDVDPDITLAFRKVLRDNGFQ
jgi:hypothetical protein